MTTLVDKFALIGRSFPSDSFEALQKAALALRAERRGRRNERVAHAWRAVDNAIILPKRLSA